MTEEERYKSVLEIWKGVTDRVTTSLEGTLEKFNPIWMMANSGARGSMNQIRQLSGMRGLMSNPSGRIIEVPVKSSFREGLTVLEYFISSHGGRKGLADTALKTANSGYLTRRLVDVSQAVIVREIDCGDTRGILIGDLMSAKGDVIETVDNRIQGRNVISDVIDPDTREIIIPAGTMITNDQAAQIKKRATWLSADAELQGRFAMSDIVDPATGTELVSSGTVIKKEYIAKIQDANACSRLNVSDERIMGRTLKTDAADVKAGTVLTKELTAELIAANVEKVLVDGILVRRIDGVLIRSVLTCNSKTGICAQCYGKNMATGNSVKVGEVVGIIAAQSIGEPGTQLTMRTFHTGGVATSEDITQGLPRVEELFEARKPKGEAKISEGYGSIRIVEENRKREIIVTADNGEAASYPLTYANKIAVENNDRVEPGTPLTEGSINPHDILRTLGVKGVQDYLIREVRLAYHLSGVEIADKHIEVIVRQMLRKVKIESQGDTDMLPGELVDIFSYEDENQRILEEGGRPATAKRCLLGITKAALETFSFLSAASFQETARVLTDAAIKNKIDPLLGLKENVIIGKLIPAGTGMKCYRKVKTAPTGLGRREFNSHEIAQKSFIDDDDKLD
jgi:DNA-directed RNA polymerase subunit beta'